MSAFLAGVPGKLKTLQDGVTTLLTNFTSTISGRIDTTISSRAPSSTALSNVTWTNGRAALLDNLATVLTINTNPIIAPPISINTPTASGSYTTIMNQMNGNSTASAAAPAGYSTALSMAGKGVINFIGVSLNAAAGGNCGCRLTVDGTVLFNSTSILGTTSGNGVTLVGAICSTTGPTLSAIALDNIPFQTSFSVEFYATAGPISMSCYSRWRKSA